MPSSPPLAVSADRFNIAAMLAEIEGGVGTSRALLARKLGLSRTTAGATVAKLLEAGLVAEVEAPADPRPGGRADGRGRPGIILDLAVDRWFALGAEYQSGRWAFAVTDLKGRVVASASRTVARETPEAFLAVLVEGLRQTARRSPGRLLPAIGVGAPGLVDCERGLISRADDLGWKSIAVGDRVREALGTEAYVINRNRGSGLAEARFGAGRGVHSLVYIGIGTGISAAFISDGRLLHGSNYSAGEIGHVVMVPDGPRCGCGKRGCLQALASGGAMASRAAALIAEGRPTALAARRGGPIRGEEVCEAAAEGDRVAMLCLEEAAAQLGLAVANIVTTFNPDKVILGGPIGRRPGPLLEIVKREAARWAMEHPYHAVSVERGSLGEYAGALGAACLVLDRKLSLVLDSK